MRYNPDTDNARLLDELAAESRRVISANVRSQFTPPSIVWDCQRGRWIPNPDN